MTGSFHHKQILTYVLQQDRTVSATVLSSPEELEAFVHTHYPKSAEGVLAKFNASFDFKGEPFKEGEEIMVMVNFQKSPFDLADVHIEDGANLVVSLSHAPQRQTAIHGVRIAASDTPLVSFRLIEAPFPSHNPIMGPSPSKAVH